MQNEDPQSTLDFLLARSRLHIMDLRGETDEAFSVFAGGMQIDEIIKQQESTARKQKLQNLNEMLKFLGVDGEGSGNGNTLQNAEITLSDNVEQNSAKSDIINDIESEQAPDNVTENVSESVTPIASTQELQLNGEIAKTVEIEAVAETAIIERVEVVESKPETTKRSKRSALANLIKR